MGRVSRFPQEVRERAVRMVFDQGSEYGNPHQPQRRALKHQALPWLKPECKARSRG